MNAVPKIAIAPILLVWFGFGQGRRIKSTPHELVELLRS